MTKAATSLAFAVCASLALGCSTKDRRQELVSHMMPLGVNLTVEGPQVMRLTLMAAVPPGQTIDVAAFTSSPPATFTLDPNSIVYEPHDALNLYSAAAVLTWPLNNDGNSPFADYSFVMRSEGLEKVVSDVVYVPSDGSLNLVPGDVRVDVPSLHQARSLHVASAQPISALLVGTREGSYRVSWYVSDGKIDDRKSADTVWTPASVGRQTIIASARPTRGYGLVVQVEDVNVVP